MKRILRELGSRTLQCGCVVGLSETYHARAIALLDVRAAQCVNSHHQPNTEMDLVEYAKQSSAPVLTATISCPHCGHQAVEPIPVNACLYFYACTGCQTVLKPKPGDCCVFCSYADRCCSYR